jgi:hypothetical protein
MTTKRKRVADAWSELNPCFRDHSLCERTSAPFAHVVVNDALGPDSFLQSLRGELATIDFHVKSNDLYEFFQSDDLRTCKLPCVARLRSLMYSERFVQFVRDVTGVADIDASVVDMSAAVYRSGGYLACHDDELDSRRVAFVLYLVDETWSLDADGGALDLYDVDAATRMPGKVVHTIAPQWNSLVLFEVCPESYHQVALVTSELKPRLTISGWYHGAPPLRPARAALPAALPFAPLAALGKALALAEATDASGALAALVQPRWLRATEALNAHFCEHSCINLVGFLRNEVFAATRAELASAALESRAVGPPCHKHYARRAPNAATTPTLLAIARLFDSRAFAAFVNALTSLEVVAVRREVRHFSVGGYTLCHDGCVEEGTVLDVVLDLSPAAAVAAAPEEGATTSSSSPPSSSSSSSSSSSAASSAAATADAAALAINETDESWAWLPSHGGHICYMDEDSELLTVPPKSNTLSIVMNNGAMRFVKMIRPSAAAPRDDVWAVLQVADDDSDNDSEEEEEEEGR